MTDRTPNEHDDLGWFGADELPPLTLADPRYLELLTAAIATNDPGVAPGASRQDP